VVEYGLKPLIPSWLWNGRRIWWWVMLIGISCVQVVLAFSGRWTVRHSLSLPFMVAAGVVAHPVMNQRLPLIDANLLKSWRIYVAVALVAISNLIELRR
jgi:hypothetical protein